MLSDSRHICWGETLASMETESFHRGENFTPETLLPVGAKFRYDTGRRCLNVPTRTSLIPSLVCNFVEELVCIAAAKELAHL